MKSDFFAGVAKTNITTACREHVTDGLFGKVLVLRQGKTSVMIVSLDAVAIGGIEEIPDDFLDQFRGEVQKRFGIGPEHILVTASHTHTAPPMLYSRRGRQHQRSRIQGFLLPLLYGIQRDAPRLRRSQ